MIQEPKSMNVKILYIDAINIHHLYGTGGGPLLRNSSNISDQFIYICMSDRDIIGKPAEIEIGCNTITYLPVYKISKLKSKIIPDNIGFMVGLFLNIKCLKQFNTCNIFTRTYTILWLFSFLVPGYNSCFYAPGLGNPMLIGRRPNLGKFLGKIYLFIQQHAVKRCNTAIAAASLDDINNFNSKLKKINSSTKFEQVPESVDINIFSPIEKTICKKKLNIEAKYIFTFVGRLAKVKGIELIIESFEIFNKNNPDSKLFIAGDGEEKDSLLKYCHHKNLGGSIFFLGNLTTEDLIQVICASNACLFASYFEGFSYAMLEILACGVPIVSTKVSGTKELILDGITGYTIDKRDKILYSKYMEKVIAIPDTQLNCRNHVVNNYTSMHQWVKISKLWPVLKLKAND
jgi:glycosyltransferase involved in cell wall biosynthesis